MTALSLIRGDLMACPSWCDRTDHDADVEVPGEPPLHHKHFGMVVIESSGGDTPGGCLGQHSQEVVLDDMTAAQLRALAEDALAAAEWIEAQR